MGTKISGIGETFVIFGLIFHMEHLTKKGGKTNQIQKQNNNKKRERKRRKEKTTAQTQIRNNSKEILQKI